MSKDPLRLPEPECSRDLELERACAERDVAVAKFSMVRAELQRGLYALRLEVMHIEGALRLADAISPLELFDPPSDQVGEVKP